MLSIADSSFNRYLELSARVSNDVVNEQYVKYFDNDGFELSYLEQEYYRENKVKLSNTLNHICDQRDWFRCNDERFKLDHSIILQRWCFIGDAREQLQKKKSVLPQLNKYLNLVPKWGVDFALEYYENDTSLEVLHIEMDYRNYYEAVASKEKLEQLILNTDWKDFVDSLLRNKSQWEGLNGMTQNDWKAVHWGLNRAEKTYKAFV